MPKVLVAGATGNVGRHVVGELVERGVSVAAFVRDADKAAVTLPAGVELRVGDFDDAASLRRAVDGVEAVFVTSSDGPQKVVHEAAVIDAAASAGAARIVKLSSIGAGVGAPVPFWDSHGRIEEHLGASSIPAVVLRANFYMTNLLASRDTVLGVGKIFAPADGAKIAMIDPRDVGAAAAVVLTAGDFEPTTYVLTGPEAITFETVAAQLSAALGRTIDFVPIPDEAARAELAKAGMPDWIADSVVALFGALRQGKGEQVTDVVARMTGRAPRTFAEFARDHAPILAG